MSEYRVPGVYKQDVYPDLPSGLYTGVPAFMGFAVQGPDEPYMLRLGAQFEEVFGAPYSNGHLACAVRGFFENGGSLCYVLRLDGELTIAEALRQGLEKLAPLDTLDLVCAPDIASAEPGELPVLQRQILEHCDQAGERFAILDSPPGADGAATLAHRRQLAGHNGALYFPWIDTGERVDGQPRYMPPCGHVAGVYALNDQRVGVHKAPANDELAGVLDLEFNLNNAQQGELNPHGVNCLRAFPGRGIRVWGARSLSDEPAWTYVSVRRLFLTAGRWIERSLAGTTFEPHDLRLWVRVERELSDYFNQLFRRGALKGGTAEQAFYVKCDDETNPPEVQEAGMVITEIGLAPATPNEFVVVRLVHGAGGVSISGPVQPA